MTMYNAGIPTGTVNLSSDYKNIQNNFSQLNTTYGVDHIAYDIAANNGLHKQVNMKNQAAPALLGDLNIYSNLDNGATSLWVQTALQNNPLFSGIPNAGASGNTSMFGNIQLRWGIVTFPAGQTNDSQLANFNVPFTTNCFVVVPGWIASSQNVTSSNNTLSIRSISSNQFRWVKNTNNSTDYTGFYYIAIGQ